MKEKPDMLQSKIEKIKQDFTFTDNLWDSKKGADVFYRRCVCVCVYGLEIIHCVYACVYVSYVAWQPKLAEQISIVTTKAMVSGGGSGPVW